MSCMPEPGYPAARAVAPRIEAHFAHHLRSAIAAGNAHGLTLPDADAIEAIIDAAFSASLRREEGYVPKISLALVPPESGPHPLRFDRPLPLSSSALVRVAPAVERPGIHLGVWRLGGTDGLRVWGTTRTVPTACFVLEVSAPGLLVIKHHRVDGGKFVNVAVLEGDQVKVIDERASTLPDCPSLLASLLAFDVREPLQTPINLLVPLAVSMRAGQRRIAARGSIQAGWWRESIVKPISYAVNPPFQESAFSPGNAPKAERITCGRTR